MNGHWGLPALLAVICWTVAVAVLAAWINNPVPWWYGLILGVFVAFWTLIGTLAAYDAWWARQRRQEDCHGR